MSRVPPSAARAIPTILITTGLLAAGTAFAGTDVGSIHFTGGVKRLTGDWLVSSPNTSATGDTLLPARVSQPSLGMELTWGRQGWPVLVALDVLHSYDDGMQRFPLIDLGSLYIPAAEARRRASTLEVGFGARRSWLAKGFSPTLGAGGAWVRGTVRYQMRDPEQPQFGGPGSELRGHDTALGFWVGGGIYRRVGPRFQLGVRGRLSKATLKIPEPTVIKERKAGETIGAYKFRGSLVDINAGGRSIGLVLGWSFPSLK